MPHTLTKTVEAYWYDELSEDAKDKAINCLYDINVSHEWWDCTYEDAATIGLKITAFDIDRGNYCKGELVESLENVISLIAANHGQECDTYKLAKQWDERLENEGETNDDEIEENTKEFTKALLEEYLCMLRREYEGLTSREATEDTIGANNYEFTVEGRFPAL